MLLYSVTEMVSTFLITGEKLVVSVILSSSLVMGHVLIVGASGLACSLQLRSRGLFSNGGSVIGGVTGLPAAVVGGAPHTDEGAGYCWLGFPRGSIPAASCAI